MGRLLHGINGPFSGKAGSVVGYVINGQGYIKGLYKKRTKRISEKEKLNRKKFATAQSWLAPLTPFVRAGFKDYQASFQGFVAAKSYLMKNALRLEGTEVKIDASLMKVSYGSMPQPKEVNFHIEDKKIRIIWDTTAIESQSPTDQALILAYDPISGNVYGEVYGPNRHIGEYTFEFNTEHLPDNPLYLYIAFISDDRKRKSDSIYLGEVEMGNLA